MDGKSTLDIIDQTEVFVGLLDGDDIHETSWVHHVSADLAVDLDETLSTDLLSFSVGQGILESVSQKDDSWQTLTHLVWTW